MENNKKNNDENSKTLKEILKSFSLYFIKKWYSKVFIFGIVALVITSINYASNISRSENFISFVIWLIIEITILSYGIYSWNKEEKIQKQKQKIILKEKEEERQKQKLKAKIFFKEQEIRSQQAKEEADKKIREEYFEKAKILIKEQEERQKQKLKVEADKKAEETKAKVEADKKAEEIKIQQAKIETDRKDKVKLERPIPTASKKFKKSNERIKNKHIEKSLNEEEYRLKQKVAKSKSLVSSSKNEEIIKQQEADKKVFQAILKKQEEKNKKAKEKPDKKVVKANNIKFLEKTIKDIDKYLNFLENKKEDDLKKQITYLYEIKKQTTNKLEKIISGKDKEISEEEKLFLRTNTSKNFKYIVEKLNKNKQFDKLQEVFGRNFYLKEENLQGVNLENANLSGVHLENTNLSGANLSGVNLEKAFLNDANLNGSNLKNANLKNANLTKAFLVSANLENANLEKTILNETNLSWANLTKCNLTKASLVSANLEKTNLTKANLSSANLNRIIALNKANLSDTNLKNIIFDIDNFVNKINKNFDLKIKNLLITKNWESIRLIYPIFELEKEKENQEQWKNFEEKHIYYDIFKYRNLSLEEIYEIKDSYKQKYYY